MLAVCWAYATWSQRRHLHRLADIIKATLHDGHTVLASYNQSDDRDRNLIKEAIISEHCHLYSTRKQSINLKCWTAFPSDFHLFPLYFGECKHVNSSDDIFILLQNIISIRPKDSMDIRLEQFGELICWRLIDNYFDLIIKSNNFGFAQIYNLLSKGQIWMNNGLELNKIEVVDVEEKPIQPIYNKYYEKIVPLTDDDCLELKKKFDGIYGKIDKTVNSHSSNTKKKRKSKQHDVPIKLSIDKPLESPKKITKPSVEDQPKKNHQKNSKLTKTKPPNILVYADNQTTRTHIAKILRKIIAHDKYVIYDLPATTTQTSDDNLVWRDNIALAVVCGNVPTSIANQLLDYFLRGGRLLCLCSDLMYAVLGSYATAEVREHELVRFTYDRWHNVEMLHYIFCYQPSPARKQFSRDGDNSTASSPSQRTPTSIDYQHESITYNLQLEVLGREETWNTPSLLAAQVKNTNGKSVFSQIHLEIDPMEYENDEIKFGALKRSDKARLEILKDILENRLGIVCEENGVISIDYTCGYFLGRYEWKMDLLQHTPSIVDNRYQTDKITLVFLKNRDVGQANEHYLPVMINSCPPDFSTVYYYEKLATQSIGRLVIYTDIITSTHHILEKSIYHGLAVIARQQSHGIGRSKNTWLSPRGSACFSLQLWIKLSSQLGTRLPLIQHLVMVAVISGVSEWVDGESIDIGIKWPNDLYAYGEVKIGGLIVNTIINGDTATVNIGCGINLDNKEPTISLNQILMKKQLKPIDFERYFAVVFNRLEQLLLEIENDGFEKFFELYYKYWLHNDAPVVVQTENGSRFKTKIKSIDDYGYLVVEMENGGVVTVQPDGNSFDMMQGLIAPKVF